MAIRYDLWLMPDDKPRHRMVEQALERFFVARFADYPHLRLPGADPYDYDAPFNRLYDALLARARDYCEREWHYVPTPAQLNTAFFRAVAHSPKFILDPRDGDSP
ncbi:hypothetical protein [Chromohalobacter canadensis]|uniref:Uncharacterized protein n=1 Tax=Chromohalobacter canadensis TaxID=141389 RepID=A0A285VVX4_9GAMM|nr:hypothetical protein [Chromohalobacter canadensis]MCK0767143.1 hypothetical protein [Chromohalobacter canadensis]WQH10252.1 hypothetical protein SR908_06150 [Chromohalobacter canadensis]SOC58240.1 hypothetical protein SAMN05421509_11515 [Chromohalobacter canadensis]